MKKTKILVVDDHKMIRDGIRSMLESLEKPHKFIIEEAENGEEAVAKALKGSFDIIVMDYQLPGKNGVDAVELIMREKSEAKILVLSNYDEYMYIDNMMKAGARGFVLKNIGPEELVKAIETVLNGNNYYSNDIAIKLLSFEKNSSDQEKVLQVKQEKSNMLSKREIEILRLIASEYTNEEIANKLFISKRTVDTHRQNLLNKLNVKNTAGLVKYAIDLKLLE